VANENGADEQPAAKTRKTVEQDDGQSAGKKSSKARKQVEQDGDVAADAPAKKPKKNVQKNADQQEADQKPANRKQVEGKPRKPAKKNAGCDPKKDADCAAM
jgi:hypothetical protein